MLGGEILPRKAFTTTLDEDLQDEFRTACKVKGDKMNNVIEALMKAYIDNDLVVEKKITYLLKTDPDG